MAGQLVVGVRIHPGGFDHLLVVHGWKTVTATGKNAYSKHMD